MKFRFVFAAAALAVASSSFAHIEIFAGTLSGLNENPANASPGTGFTTVTFDLDLVTMRVQSTFSGLTGNTTASHIHVPTAVGINGPVATQTPSFPGFPLGVTAGTFDQTYDMSLASSYNATFIANNGGTVSGALNALVLALQQGRAYHNIHTSTFGPGEIRANLQPVPEPASMAVLGMGALALLRKRRK